MTEMKKPKVLLAITKAHWGGAQKYVFDLANYLVEEKYDVSVLVGGHGPLKTKLDQAEIKTTSLPSLGRDIDLFPDLKAFWRIYRFIRKEKPDILHLNSSKMMILGGLAGRLAGCKNIIYTGHGWAFNEDRSYISKYFLSLLYFFGLQFVDKIIFVSQTTMKQAMDFGFNFSDEKIVVIHNGVTPIDFLNPTEARQTIIELLPWKNAQIQNFWIGTIAELHPSKGLIYSIEAMRKLPSNINYIIIGSGEKRMDLEFLIKAYNLESQVHLVGPVSGAAKLLKAFDLFVLPSVTEALPYAILEAGIAERAVIASSVGGIPEIITDDQNGILVPPRAVNNLSDEILNLITDSEKRLMLGRNLRQKVMQDFSAEKMLAETNKIYRAML